MRTSILSPNLSGCVSILDVGVTYLATYVNERTDHSATIWDFTFNYNPVLSIGDINQDEVINLDDLFTLLGIISLNLNIEEQVLILGDLNYDGILDVFDLLLLIDII